MTSVLFSSGLNYQNGINPIGREVRAIKSNIDELKKEIAELKLALSVSGGGGGGARSGPTITEIVHAIRTDSELLRTLKGEPGPAGPAGPQGPKGEIVYVQTVAPPAPAASS